MSRQAEFPALAVGLVVGLMLGLVYTWVIDPVELYNTTPSFLRLDYRHDWVRMAALGYVYDGDLERARLRLQDLDRQDVDEALGALIETYVRQGRPADTMRALSNLAYQLEVNTPAMAVYLTPIPTSPPSASPPASPPSTPTPFSEPHLPPPPTPAPSATYILFECFVVYVCVMCVCVCAFVVR